MSADLALRNRPVEGLAKRLVEDTVALYRPAGRFAYFFARGKLRNDPLFTTLLRVGAIPDAARVVDLGCGQGLLGAWFASARRARIGDDHDRLPSMIDQYCVDQYCGIDQSTNDVARARTALPGARIIEADLRHFDVATLGPCDVIALLDALHYFEPHAQERLLRGAHTALRDSGALILRVCDAASASASRRANIIDMIVCAMRGHPRARLHRRSIAEWIALLESIDFTVEILDDDRADAEPQRKYTAFANVLLRARKRKST